jgi:hypothetical protein
VMVLLVRGQMLGQLVYATREQRHLNFRGAAIVKGARVGSNYFPFTGDREGHQEFSIFPSFLCYPATVTEPSGRVKSVSVGTRESTF